MRRGGPRERPIYLDYQATTPLDPRVYDAMAPYFRESFGNPHSVHHSFGWEAEGAVERARAQVADLVGADPREIVFTSGATESNNLAIKGVARFHGDRKRHIITCVTEHKCVLESCRRLEAEGFSVTTLPVRENGLVEVAKLADAVVDDTVLVSIMAANNEIGVVQPLEEIGALCRERGVLFHTDAAQAVGKIPLDVRDDAIDLLSLSAHKVYGPKGVGALFVRQGTPLLPQVQGGSQERQRRAGTEDVPGIVGFGVALELAQRDASEREAANRRMAALRDTLLDRLTAMDDVQLTGHPVERLPNSASVAIDGVEGGDLVAALDLEGIAASTGSACTSGSTEPSHVLLAMGLDPRTAHGSLRLTLGRETTAVEIRATADAVERCAERLRGLVGPRPAVASV
jgi:cysteine desulfurase